MAQKQTEKQKVLLDPTNTRLWAIVIVFLLTFQNLFVPKSVLIRFIGNLWHGMIFQFLPTSSEPWQLIQHGLTYLVLAWLFLRSAHRHMGSIGGTIDAWRIGFTWGIGAFFASAVVLFLGGGVLAGFDSTPSLFGFMPVQLGQFFNAFGQELCYRAFLQTSIVIIAIRILKDNQKAAWLGIAVSTLFYTVFQAPELTDAGFHGFSLVGALIHTSLIFALLVSVIYAITNNLVLVAFIHGGYYALSYWTVDGIYAHFPADIFLLTVIGISLLAYKSNPGALKSAPLAIEV